MVAVELEAAKQKEIDLREHEAQQIYKYFNKLERQANKTAEQSRKAEEALEKKRLKEAQKQAVILRKEEKKRLAEEKKASQSSKICGKRAACDGGSQMGPPSKRYCILLPGYPIDYRPPLEELDMAPVDDHSLEELDIAPDDDHSEEEGYNAYPDPEASQVGW